MSYVSTLWYHIGLSYVKIKTRTKLENMVYLDPKWFKK